tara:strand:- start:5762 stop:6655 length:894 start_codon:yes stop_codon:yes gene_type:complete
VVRKIIKNKLGNQFRRITVDRYPFIFRPSSKPFLSGDSLRIFSNHIFDETKSFDPNKVKKGDILFLKTELKNIFFNHYHPKIKEPYKLITHNSDLPVENDDLKYLDEKIIHWFATKLNTLATEKISCLPYGIENKRFVKNGKVKNFEKVLIETKNNEKERKVFCSFNPSTNPTHREPIHKNVLQRQDIFVVKSFSDNLEYLRELSKYKFNLCPEGNFFESHRIWESLIFGCTPIVEKNTVNENFFNIGIPLIMLESFDELTSISIDDLEQKNKANENKEYSQFSNLDYWKEIIDRKL